jgi:hypothetical protein
MGDLKGGTTGQVLSKTTGTDMDFTWVTTDDTNAIQNAIVDAKGDLIAATAADTPARLAVGANNLLLTADSTQATGLNWTGAWTTWTPTWTNLTVGNGTTIARYVRIANTVTFSLQFTFGSTSVITGDVSATLPITPVTDTSVFARFLDSGTANYIGFARCGTGGTINILTPVANQTYLPYTSLSALVPFTWTTSDTLNAYGTYEVA